MALDDGLIYGQLKAHGETLATLMERTGSLPELITTVAQAVQRLDDHLADPYRHHQAPCQFVVDLANRPRRRGKEIAVGGGAVGLVTLLSAAVVAVSKALGF